MTEYKDRYFNVNPYNYKTTIKDGAADKSYGIEVAKLAGLPEDLTARARVLLEAREAEARPTTQQMALFVPSTKPQRKEASAAIPAIALQELRELEQLRELKAKILDAEINSLTPLASLTLLSELQNRVKQGK